MTERYGFTVHQQTADWTPEFRAEFEAFVAARPDGYRGVYSDPDCPRPPLIDRWSVFLPHQCDAWEITDGCKVDGVWLDPTQQNAIIMLEMFIAEANEALTALKAGRNYPDEPDDD